jgi:hypothetical protein
VEEIFEFTIPLVPQTRTSGTQLRLGQLAIGRCRVRHLHDCYHPLLRRASCAGQTQRSKEIYSARGHHGTLRNLAILGLKNHLSHIGKGFAGTAIFAKMLKCGLMAYFLH